MAGHDVTLHDWEYAWAVHVGLGRDAANARKQDAAYYDPRRMEPNKRASIASACSEMAVAKATRRYWSGSMWDSSRHREFAHLPDVEPNIEVRRTRKADGALPIRQSDVDRDRVMFLAFPWQDVEFQTVTVLGWCVASEVWDLTVPAPYDDTGKSRLLSQEHLTLRPPPGGWG